MKKGISALWIILIAGLVLVLIVVVKNKKNRLTLPIQPITTIPQASSTPLTTSTNPSTQISPVITTNRSVQVVISQDELNTLIGQSIVGKQTSTNPITSIAVALHAGKGSLTVTQAKGQVISAGIVVVNDKELALSGITVTNAGLLTNAYETIARDTMSTIFTTMISNLQNKKVESIAIEEGKLVLTVGF